LFFDVVFSLPFSAKQINRFLDKKYFINNIYETIKYSIIDKLISKIPKKDTCNILTSSVHGEKTLKSIVYGDAIQT